VLHEFGHFLPARWFKTRVEKFYLFFDCRAPCSSARSENTEFGIGMLPLGGYVKISGMIDESMDKEQMQQPAQGWEFRAKPAWQRLIIMLGGVTVNLILGCAIYIMILYVWGREVMPRGQAPLWHPSQRHHGCGGPARWRRDPYREREETRVGGHGGEGDHDRRSANRSKCAADRNRSLSICLRISTSVRWTMATRSFSPRVPFLCGGGGAWW
jgi:membrane-associated protease RseP (regulator of RpoE activity)